jgi:hypothetical protein
MDQLPLENFEKVELEFLFVKILLFASYYQKLVSWRENGWLWEIGGVFDTVINFYWNNSLYVSTSVFDLELGNWGRFAKTNQVVAKNDPYMPNLNQNNFELLFGLILHLFYLLYVVLAWITKKGRLKGKCALGPFLSILVIECQLKCFCVDLCNVANKVQIMSKGMFLDLVHCFMD